MNKNLRAAFIFLLLFMIWEGAARWNHETHLFLPAPSEVILYLYTSLKDGSLLRASLITLERLFEGYFCSLSIGIPLGLLNARFQICKDTLGLLILGLQSLPSVCWVPLAVMWFGQQEETMLFIVIMGSIGSIATAVESGVRHVPPIYLKAARTMGSTGLHTWIYVIIPATFPYVLNGMKLGWAFAWRSLMAAEIYITILTGLGLGHLLHYARELHAMDGVVGIMLVIIFIGIVIEKLVFAPVETFLHRRWGTTTLSQ